MFKLENGSNLNKIIQIAKHINSGATLNFEKALSSEPAFLNVGDVVKVNCEFAVNINGAGYHFPVGQQVQLEALTVGADYAIYATSTGLIASENFTFPSGLNENNSRIIGGFHYGDSRIYPRSFWDLKFKPACDDPRGMVRTFSGFWADIYLLNTSPEILGTSAFNAPISKFMTTPQKPVSYGGYGQKYEFFNQQAAMEVLSAHGKRLPNHEEFRALASGSVTGYSYIEVVGSLEPDGSAYFDEDGNPVFISAPTGLTLFDEQARSLIDCEMVSGYYYQFSSTNGIYGLTDARFENVDQTVRGSENGSSFAPSGLGSPSIYCVLMGGSWKDGAVSAVCGAGCADYSKPPLSSSDTTAARGICDHYQCL